MTETIKLADLQPDQNNANRGTERGRYMLEQSIRKLGAGRSILLDKNGRIIAGNKTAETAADIGLEDVVIVRTSGDQIVAVLREDLDLDDPTGKARELAYVDNRTGQVSLDFDPDVMKADLEMGLDLSDWWQPGELDLFGVRSGAGHGETGGEPLEFLELPLAEGVPDTVWPSDNHWGIPTLDINRQADAFDLPIETWGAKKRGTKAGTLHFYTEDYRFNAIWDKPASVLKASAVNIVEPNFSVYDQVPRVFALWQTYKKRWLARYWQTMGARIFVDLNVARPYDDINLIGVPRGWQSYATRGYTGRLSSLDEELEIAKAHAGGSVLFLVYGGGVKVIDWCKAHAADGALWVADDMDRAKGKYLEGSYG